MKYNLLEIVSDILNDMDSDFVSDINDTDEAAQVAQIVKTTYQAMMSNRNWPHTLGMLNLTAPADNTLPTHMTMPDNVKELVSVFYDVRKVGETRLQYRQLKYLDPDDFLRYTNARNSDSANASVINDPTGVKLILMKNKAPEYYTSFDDNTMVFDSYDMLVDTTIQSNKTQARAYSIPPFELTNEFVPDLPDEAFSALIEEAKSKAMFKLKQMQDVKAEQEAGRQNRWLSQKAWKVHEKDIYPNNYGRGRRGRYRDPTFRNN